jgi:hypothetical protein
VTAAAAPTAVRRTGALSRRLLLAAGLAASGLSAASPSAQSSAPSRTRAHVAALASERLEGRLAGSDGERLAADYIVAELQRIGARPLPGAADYRLPFGFTAGTRDGGSVVTLIGRTSRTFDARSDVQALAFSDSADVSGPVVFAGYGLVVPDGQEIGYDSYAGLDVRDKIVVVLRYFPEETDAKTRGLLGRYAALRYKAMAARQRGAKALLVVTGPRSPNAGELVPMTFDTALAGSGIAAASVSGEVGSAIFAALGDPARTLEATQRALDPGNPHVAGFEIPGLTIAVKTAVVRETRTGYNVAAYLPANAAAAVKPWIALGAHYDHLGRGDHGQSLASGTDAGGIHHGADDNASGAAAVLSLAELLAASPAPRPRHLLLLFWSGEEIGLLGSSAWVNAPPIALDQTAAYLNFDMVGRMEDNKLTVQATGTSPAWPGVIEPANVAAGFDLQLQQDPYLPTDSASFNQAGIPTLNFFTGAHTDYHKPTDTAAKIAYEDLDRVVRFAAAIVGRLARAAEAPPFTKVEQRMDAGAGRAAVRVFTGTVPDYATDAKGLLLGGVIGGGPAEQAGLRKGDLIVEIAGQTITNIYDYTYALEILKIGEPARVVYRRDGERRETTLIPAARR